MPRFEARHANCSRATIAIVTAILGISGAQAAVPITGTQLQSNVGTTVLPDFQGGTLEIDQLAATDSHAYNVENFPTNTVDAFGHTIDFIGVFSGSGPLTITDSVGGGTVTLANVETYSGTTTINSGAKLQLGDGGGVHVGLLSGAITDNGALLFNEGGGTLSNFVTGITGTGSSTIVSGTLQLSGDNTYTGSTTVNGGATLQITGTGSIAASSGVVDNGTFDISGASAGVSITSLSGSGVLTLGAKTLTLTNASGTFTGNAGVATGGLTIAGGTETLTGVYSYSGTTQINSGATLALGNGGGTVGLLGGAINDDGLIVFNGGGGSLAIYATGITGSGAMTLQSGTLELTGINTYSGTTTIDSGATLQLGTGGGTIGLLAGPITDNGALVFDGGGGSFAIFFTGITGTGTAELTSGTLELGGTNTYTGTTTIDVGSTLQLGVGGTTGSVAGNIVDNGVLDFNYSGPVTTAGTISGSGNAEVIAGTAVVTGFSTIGGTVTIDPGATLQWGNANAGLLVGGTGTVDNGALVMDFGGAGVLVGLPISGSGTVELKSGSINLTGTNTYSGTTTIDPSAFFALTVTGSIANSTNIIDNGTFDISGETTGASITTLSGTGGVSLGGKLLTITNASGTFGGVIADGGFLGGTGGSLTIAGGTQTLSGTNTFTGPTTVNIGATLVLGNGGTTGTVAGDIVDNGLVKFNYGGAVINPNHFTGTGNAEVVAGTAIITGFSTIGGTVTIDPGATMQWGNASAGLLGGGGGTVDNGALVMDFGGAGVLIGLPISGSGTVEMKSGSVNLTGTNTYSGATTIDPSAFFALTVTGSIANSTNIIDNGTFDISGETTGASITTLSGTGGVSLGGKLLTITNASGNFGGVIADGGFLGGTGGSLTIAGGTQTLSGTNTFTGPTTVNVGATLQLGAGGTTGTVAGNIVDNGLVKFNYSGAVINPNHFTGTGSAEVVAGTAVITGFSVIGGTVTIDPGATMQWGNAGAGVLGGGGGTVDNGALVMDFGGAGVLVGLPISGSGTVEMKSGSVNLTGTNTYTGVTTIDPSGILALTVTGSIANSTNVIDNGIFDISGETTGASITTLSGTGGVSLGGKLLTITNASGTYGGVMADGGILGGTGGSLTIAGGSQTLTGTNTFTGITTINPGATLQLGAGTTTGTVAGPITDNGALKFNYSGPVTVASAITGSGSVEVVAGTAVVTATGSVGGAVTIDSGATLEWGHVGGAPEFLTGGSGGLVDNGALVIDFNGGGVGGTIPISGSGTFTILTGSLNNSGVSTYTGSTTIASPAILLLSNAGSIANSSGVVDNGLFDIAGTTAGTSIVALAGAGKVNLGSRTLTITNASGTFSGVLADGGIFFPAATGGGLTIAGGSETLTGTNTFTGTTTVASGATLQLGVGGTTGSVAGPIVDNGVLKFDYAGTITAGNAISGTGTAELVAGTLVTTASSVVGGTVKIDTGATLQWGNGALGFLAGNAGVINNGALVLNFGGGSLSGPIPISGTGTFSILSGKFTNAGVSTYTGSTAIASGASLLLSGAGTIAGSSGVTDNGTFDVSQTTAGTSITTLSGAGTVDLGSKTLTLSNASGLFTGVIADGGAGGGTGASLVIASGSETLDGVNTYTGTTTIGTGATLIVGDASHPSASLDSHMGGVLVGAGGTLEGHGSIAGAVTNTSGGTVAPGGTIGTLTVASYTQGANSTLQIEVSPAAASELNSLGAASLNGTLHLVFDPGIYVPHLYQIVAGNPVSGTFATVTSSGAPNVVFGVFYPLGHTAVDLLAAPVEPAEVYGSVSTATLDRAHGLASLVEDRLRDLRCTGRPDEQNVSCEGTEIWAQGFGATDGVDNQGTRVGFSDNGYGFVGGVDEHWSEGSTLGVAFSYESDTLGQSATASKASGSSYFGAVYGRWVADGLFLDGEGFYMHSDWDVSRIVPGFGTALSSPSGDTKGLLFQISAPVDDGDLRPYLRGTYADFDRSSATETGAGVIGYAVNSGSTDLGTMEGGLIWSHGYAMSEGLIRPALQLGFEESFGNRTPSITAGLASVPGTSFTVSSASPAHAAGVAGASLSLDAGNGFEITGSARALIGGGQNQAEFTLGASYRF